jgi:hypothetical protein
MVASPSLDRLSGMPVGRALSRRWGRSVRRMRQGELAPALLLGVTCLVIGIAQYQAPTLPLTALALPMVIGNLVLGPRTLP